MPKRRLELLVSAKELAGPRKAWKAPAPPAGSDRGYAGLFQKDGAAGRRRRRFRLPRTGEIVSDAALPGISVVVTCYNCRDYIADAIRSVARQTLRDFECVIVDDASTDDSAEVVRRTLDELADPRFSQIRLEKNVGQTGATRRGLAATKGTFVCFLDSDDLWNEISSSAISRRT